MQSLMTNEPLTVRSFEDMETLQEASPFVTEFFMVQGLGYRGMAYCDHDGTWRNAFNHFPLMGRIYLLE